MRRGVTATYLGAPPKSMCRISPAAQAPLEPVIDGPASYTRPPRECESSPELPGLGPGRLLQPWTAGGADLDTPRGVWAGWPVASAARIAPRVTPLSTVPLTASAEISS